MARICITTNQGKTIYEGTIDSAVLSEDLKGRESRRVIFKAAADAVEQDAEDDRQVRNIQRGGPWVEVAEQKVGRGHPGWGVDHGSEGTRLLEKHGIQLVWRKGHTGWCGLGGTAYYKAQLEVHGHRSERFRQGKVIHKGRLTKAALKALEPVIKELFDVDSLPPLKAGTTYVYVGAGEHVNEKGQVVKDQKAS